MTNNFWNNIARSTVRELGRAAGLRASNEQAVLDLTEKYGQLPTVEFVDEMWPVLRDGWLTRSAPHRTAVVTRMRELGKGNMSLKVGIRSGQLAYLRSLRRSPALADVVLQVFLESGAEERQPPVFVDPPVDAEAQEARFFATARERLLKIDETTIEGFEQAVHAAIHDVAAGLSLPIAEPGEAASRIVHTFATVVVLEEKPEPVRTALHPYQRVILSHLAERIPDVASVQRLLGIMSASLVGILIDPQTTQKSVGDWAAAVLMAILAFDSPDDAPPNFVNEIIVAQRRFASSPDGPDSSGPVEERQRFDEALGDLMSRVPNASRPADLDGGALGWNVFMGSAVVNVVRVPFTDHGPSTLRFQSPLVRAVQLTEDLSASLNLVNAKEWFYKFYWHDDTVWMEYEFILDSFNERLFGWSLRRFASMADDYDTMFRGRFGGATMADDRKAVFDA